MVNTDDVISQFLYKQSYLGLHRLLMDTHLDSAWTELTVAKLIADNTDSVSPWFGLNTSYNITAPDIYIQLD